MGKPRRLPPEAYRGTVCVFITCATHERHPAFADPAVCTNVCDSLRRESAGHVELTAYCLMPNHGHFLLTGLCEGADLSRTVRRWKQSTGYHYSRAFARPLWQGNYWDWVLRDGADAFAIAKYIVSDPLRTELVTNLLDYQWWGSERWTRQELIIDIWDAQAPQWWSRWRPG